MPAVSTMRNRRLCQKRLSIASRRAGHIADEHALLAQQPIHQRGLADVGPSDEGDADLRGGGWRLEAGVWRRFGCELFGSPTSSLEPLHNRIEHLGDAGAVLGRDFKYRVDPESIEIERGVASPLVVELVYGKENRASARSQFVAIISSPPRTLAVSDETSAIALFDRCPGRRPGHADSRWRQDHLHKQAERRFRHSHRPLSARVARKRRDDSLSQPVMRLNNVDLLTLDTTAANGRGFFAIIASALTA